MAEISVIQPLLMDRAENIRRIKEQAKLPKEKKKYTIPKKSAKKLKQEAEERNDNKASGGSKLNRWYLERRLSMTGVCGHCGAASSKNSDAYFRSSICHILPKSIFPSVATHESNWIELCCFGNDCHGNMDHHTLDLAEMNCYDTIIERFVAMYPDISLKEKKRIPDILLQYIKNETDI